MSGNVTDRDFSSSARADTLQQKQKIEKHLDLKRRDVNTTLSNEQSFESQIKVYKDEYIVVVFLIDAGECGPVISRRHVSQADWEQAGFVLLSGSG